MDDQRVFNVKQRLEAAGGGYEIVHSSPGLEIGVYVLVAPEPDRQQPHADDEVYIVLEGRGVLNVEGEEFPLGEGSVHFVPAGAEHRFTGYEGLTVLVIFSRQHHAPSAGPVEAGEAQQSDYGAGAEAGIPDVDVGRVCASHGRDRCRDRWLGRVRRSVALGA